MKNHNSSYTAAVGFFVILALAALFFLGFKASNLGAFNPQNVYRVTAIFGDIGGLGKDAKVSMAGVQIGRVGQVELLKDGKTSVELIIASDFLIPSDSGAQILTSGLLGERYVGINRGISGKNLADGGKIANTGGSLVLEKVLQQFAGGGIMYPEKFYKLTAKFTDASGIAVDTPVKQSGVQIGRVSSVQLDQNTFQAVVTMEIDAQYGKIPLDSSADVLSTSLIGGKYIGITPGGETAYLTDGGEFQYANSAVVLEKLIQQFVSNMTMKQ
ncbi:MAG: outer membrane lipid asymmetry maintenance protein MlaD [Cardiobacteriaceae bacterium]|nr:outer membrane lipid asymmetry maintenance protein MlaD [Cardiobacteriaceae bacterium]